MSKQVNIDHVTAHVLHLASRHLLEGEIRELLPVAYLAADPHAPGRQLDALEKLGAIEFFDDVPCFVGKDLTFKVGS